MLRVLAKYKESFGFPVGLSCHYQGDEMLYVAVAMGANLLEKGVVEDPTIVEQDLVSAAKLSEVPQIVQKVQNCWEAIGNAHVMPTEPRDLSLRKGLIAVEHIDEGSEITLSKLGFAWPPVGISGEYVDIVSGSLAVRDINLNETINWNDIRFKR